MKSIRQKKVDLRNLKLSPEEGFVLSRVDGTSTVKDLVALTGLDEGRVVDIIARLSDEGAVEVSGGPEAERAAVEVATAPTASEGPGIGDEAIDNEAIDDELRAFLRGDPESPAEELDRNDEPASSGELLADASEETSSADVDVPAANTETANDEPEEDAEETARTEREYRKLYETVYHPMSRDERVKAAGEVSGARLLALCLDPDPQVIHAVFANTHLTLECPRLIATHHRTHIGLEHIAKRSDFLADAIVQRRLLRNPQLPNTILGRMVNPKLMMEVYKIAIDREIPERSRMMTREVLRKKFMLSSSDERAALLFKTEGRCLVLLVNCSLDAHATQILCSKNSYTILFIQNLARWSATPPALLAHLLKMPVVRRNLGLRKMLLKHPNTPSDLRRSGAL
ncbi:MAG: hypothetical protein BGO98_46910 [Myxococcales bacterium 68-20]|nr:MAG: hypothetical protein BGO98_46910 [Myxococcales bacterium 68-20]